MYSLFKQIHPPTGLEHSVYCNFFHPWEKNLVVAGVNQLHVYRINSEPDVSMGQLRIRKSSDVGSSVFRY